MNYLRPEWNLLVNITRLFNSVSAEPRTMEIRVSSLEAKGERANSRMKHGKVLIPWLPLLSAELRRVLSALFTSFFPFDSLLHYPTAYFSATSDGSRGPCLTGNSFPRIYYSLDEESLRLYFPVSSWRRYCVKSEKR